MRRVSAPPPRTWRPSSASSSWAGTARGGTRGHHLETSTGPGGPQGLRLVRELDPVGDAVPGTESETEVLLDVAALEQRQNFGLLEPKPDRVSANPELHVALPWRRAMSSGVQSVKLAALLRSHGQRPGPGVLRQPI